MNVSKTLLTTIEDLTFFFCCFLAIFTFLRQLTLLHEKKHPKESCIGDTFQNVLAYLGSQRKKSSILYSFQHEVLNVAVSYTFFSANKINGY